MRTYNKHLLAVCMMFIPFTALQAQKKQVKPVKKQQSKTEIVKPAISMQDIMPATAKIVFVDSIVVDKNNFMNYIPLNSDCGKLCKTAELLKGKGNVSASSYAYINDFGDKCFYNDSTRTKHSRLFTAEKLAGKWQQSRMIEELGEEYKDVNYPYLMPDGVTLYFSAVNKKNSLGGRDIFVTRLNTDSMRFYKPENIGLPYNSTANDYCCIIDDINSLGWLATDRNQPAGKVCIYTFIPSDERWTDEIPDIQEKRLAGLAHISRIADTWMDRKAVENAKSRLQTLRTGNMAKNEGEKKISFVVNDKVVYNSVSQFRSATSIKMFKDLNAMKEAQSRDESKLEACRETYTKAKRDAKKNIAQTIMKLEKDCEKRENEIKNLDKKIRNAENLM